MRDQVLKATEDLYTLISQKKDPEEVTKKIDNLIELMQKYTDRNSKELTKEEKLYLMYALRDILDDIKLTFQTMVHEQKKENLQNEKNSKSWHIPMEIFKKDGDLPSSVIINVNNGNVVRSINNNI